jgi:hypothetical protein
MRSKRTTENAQCARLGVERVAHQVQCADDGHGNADVIPDGAVGVNPDQEVGRGHLGWEGRFSAIYNNLFPK